MVSKKKNFTRQKRQAMDTFNGGKGILDSRTFAGTGSTSESSDERPSSGSIFASVFLKTETQQIQKCAKQ